jgi:hypothetical protein
VKEMMELSKRDVRQRFDYVPIDKSRPLIYRQDTSRTKRGDPVGSFCRRNDHYVGGVGGKNYLIHRLVWLWKDPATSVYSAVPKVLDHINQDHHDNRYENLRPVTQSLNGINSKLDPNHHRNSKFRGVSINRSGNKNKHLYWKATLQNRLIDTFPYTNQGEIEAALAYDRELYKKFGETNGLNFPENKANYMGLNEHEQLEFGFCDESPAQQVLDLSHVVLVR